jgi:lipoprotein NlpD
MKTWQYMLWMLAAAMLLAGCASTVDYRWPTLADAQSSLYTIRKGESLYAIAWHYGLNYKQLASWNNIGPPYTIYPGQRIRLSPPPTYTYAQTATSPPPAPTSPKAPPPYPIQSVHVTPMTPRPYLPPAPAAPSHAGPSGWQWPAQGEIINSFAPDGSKKGIDIAGQPGEPIHAASSGKVVYSGGGLVGYGQLIIIKHNHDFLSAYAHNRKLLVKEGERVSAGQTIAELGSTGAQRPMLHFEIRQDGQPVDPLQYLPQP